MSEIVNTSIIITTCAHCGIHFGMPDYLYERIQKDHRMFYCPNGDAMRFRPSDEEEDLKEKYENERNKTIKISSELDQAKAEISAIKKTRRWRRKTKKENTVSI